MSGHEILDFLEEIWFDLTNPLQADWLSLGFRIFAVFIVVVVVWGLLTYMLQTIQKLLSPLFRHVHVPRLPRRRKKPIPPDNTYMEALKAKQEAEEAQREAQRQAELEKVLKALEIKKE